jgi:hypothetical protein
MPFLNVFQVALALRLDGLVGLQSFAVEPASIVKYSFHASFIVILSISCANIANYFIDVVEFRLYQTPQFPDHLLQMHIHRLRKPVD